MPNETEVDPSTPTAAELRRDVLNRPAPSADFGGFHEDEGGPDDDGTTEHCASCGALRCEDAEDCAFADSDDGVLARHPFDLGGES